jgi:hypothetical protein
MATRAAATGSGSLALVAAGGSSIITYIGLSVLG